MKTFLVKGLVCKDEPVRKLFNFLGNLFNKENSSCLTLKHEPVRKHFNLLKNLFKYENFPHKWIGSQSMNRYARISTF